MTMIYKLKLTISGIAYAIILFLFPPQFLNAQHEYQALLLDKSTHEPIENANVFIVNSTKGFYSDKHGRFIIPGEMAPGADLIFSHVNYEAVSVHIPLLYPEKDTIYLNAISHEIEDVTIKAERNDFLKEMRLVGFRQDLFDFVEGKKNMYKEVKFLNPEDIYFEIIDTSLTAKATNLLRFKNEYLGYEMHCLLEKYQRDSENLIFEGKATYKEYPSSKRKRKKYQKRREKHWKESQQNFFRSVVYNNLDKKSFECRALLPSEIEKGYQTVLDFESLVFPTKVKGVYALLAPVPITVISDKKQSYIIAEEGVVLLNKEGVILNKKEVKIRGYWEELSLTKILPSNFRTTNFTKAPVLLKPHNSISELRLIAKELMDKPKNDLPVDEIFLETERYYYNSMNRVLVEAFVYDHQSRKPIHNCLVRVELVNDQGRVVNSKTKKSEKGICYTSFLLSDTLTAGQYGVRAYTNHMRNFSEQLYGKTSIALNMVEQQKVSLELETFNLSFHSEGGKLLYDCDNRVVITVTDKYNRPIHFVGSLKDQFTGETQIIKTILPGLAVLDVHPRKNSRYIVTTNTEEVILSNLDEFIPVGGTNLGIYCRNKERFKVSIHSNKDDVVETLRIYNRKKLVHSMKPSLLSSFSISKTYLPNEILLFQLVGEKDQILSERIVDNRTFEVIRLLELKKKYRFFYTNQRGEIEIVPDTTSIYFIDSLPWNVRIIHSEFMNKKRVENWLEKPLIESENLVGISALNSMYIRNLSLIGNEIKEDYTSLYRENKPIIKYEGEFPLTLKGKLTNPDPPFNSERGRLSATSMTEIPMHTETITDDDGNFVFEDLPYAENLGFIIQARKNVGLDDEMLDGDRFVEITLDSNKVQFEKSRTRFNFRKDLVPNDSLINVQNETKKRFSETVQLDEVIIKDRVSNSVSSGLVKDFSGMNWIPKRTKGSELLRILYPNRVARRSTSNPGQMEVLVNTRKDGFVYLPLVIMINGDLEFNAARFESIEADQIKYFVLSENVLNIITTPGYKPRSVNREDDLGILVTVLEETVDDTSLDDINAINNQSSKENNRKTLFWNPKLKISEGSQKISFQTSSHAGSYTLIASTIHPTFGYISYSIEFEVLKTKE